MKARHWGWIALAAAGVAASAVYLRDIGRAYERLRSAGSLVMASPFGDIEYAEGGAGPPVLVVHGSGGGWDQGELLAHALLADGLRWIAPSRFGYLRSALPAGASFDTQAHAFAHLLDRLGIDRVAVVALSHGGPSALLFALLHPERVSSLTLLSCGVATSSDAGQAAADRKGAWLVALYRHDLPYWLASRVLRRPLLALLGVDDAVVAALTPAQRDWVDRVVDAMNPASLRSAGVAFDHRAALPGARIAGIGAPTLVVHASDDRLQLFHNAEFAAATIPGARLLRFDHGGHLVMAAELDAVRAAVRAHIAAHLGHAGAPAN